jgi:L-ribulose-5-phosphate 3-epimerase
MKWEIGVRAHDFGRMPLSELAPRIAAAGFGHIQLALGKALNDFQYTCGILSNGLARSIDRELSRNNLRPSVIGCYINPAEENAEALQANMKMFKEHIRFAREMGCKIVATETGHIIPDSNEEISRNKAFERVIRFVSEVTEEAEKFGVLVAIEAVSGHTINTPRAMDRVFGLIPSNNLCALVDIVNMIHPAEASGQNGLIDDVFNLYRERINVFHMKDFKIAGTAKESAIIGQGEHNLAYLLNKIKEEKPYADIILEEVMPDSASEARELVFGLLGQ